MKTKLPRLDKRKDTKMEKEVREKCEKEKEKQK